MLAFKAKSKGLEFNIISDLGMAEYIETDESKLRQVLINLLGNSIKFTKKGSITLNGVSLTVVNSLVNEFSVAIIPYTYEHTNFKTFSVGTKVNMEFDVIGKYVARLNSLK
jgi:riboflavin synthase alpha subunit